MGQVMVKLKKFWYTTDHTTTAGTYKWWISDTGTDTLPTGADHAWAVHPAFIRNGVTKDYIFLGAFEAYAPATKLESVAGFQPTTGLTLAQYRTAAELRAGTTNKWEIQDYLTTSAVQLLYLIEYGTFSSQTALSAGITNMSAGAANESCTTGHTGSYGTDLGNASGDVAFTAEHEAITTHAMSYRGIENFYGNTHTYIDGINITDAHRAWIADHGFATNYMAFATPYIDSKLTLSSTDGWVTDIVTEATVPSDYGFLPSAVGGSSTTKLCDRYYQYGGQNVIVAFGGPWYYGTDAGMFHWDVEYLPADVRYGVGTRLMYIG
jgi:hypothetical protein